MAKEKEFTYHNDEEALIDFLVVHWAHLRRMEDGSHGGDS
jgi:hypothetical protein